MLIVICPAVNKGYIMDSLPGSCDISTLQKELTIAFKIASSSQGNGKSIKWENLKCVRQVGAKACGYYVMRFLWEVCFVHQGSSDIGKVSLIGYQGRNHILPKKLMKFEMFGVGILWM
ncbi:unnamed protein product [Cuscuta epithymum]|uniref:Uncharacterized protein n=1 Tax=Cuscuta epithymum TaxID=186058 RepID=A0AAV0CHK2_9ASTE|nr:unnamed protein product [Cuscuta epithymum]